MNYTQNEKMQSVDGVGSVTVSGFISEVGDISRFKNLKQIQKYAGFELIENTKVVQRSASGEKDHILGRLPLI